MFTLVETKTETETDGIEFYDNVQKCLHWMQTETDASFHWFCTHFMGISLGLGVRQRK